MAGEGAHGEIAVDRGEQRQLDRRQHIIVCDLSAVHPSTHTRRTQRVISPTRQLGIYTVIVFQARVHS